MKEIYKKKNENYIDEQIEEARQSLISFAQVIVDIAITSMHDEESENCTNTKV